MSKENINFVVDGHVLIKDDLGNTLLDKKNAVHPQNISRVIARALSNESNFWIHRIAFGNGGTQVSANLDVTYNTPNDGITPDPAGYSSQLYNETYWEIVDESNALIGTGPGAVQADDPASVEHTSGPGVRSSENGGVSQVIISVTLNPSEPTGQAANSFLGSSENPEESFTFDEIGLFTTGLPASPTSGYQNVGVGSKTSTDSTGLSPSTTYNFQINVNAAGVQTISITTPAVGSGSLGEITYDDLISLINTSSIVGATASITNNSTVQTYGKLRITSSTTGVTSTINIIDPGSPYASDYLFSNLTDFSGIEAAEDGLSSGVQNAPTNPSSERERLLTHLIFSPINKNASRSLIVTYTLTVAVARSASAS